jgi:hypothetical protein
MVSKWFVLCAAIALLSVSAFGAPITNGTMITYNVTLAGGTTNDYIYTYVITNNGSLPGNAPVQALDIYFDPSLFSQSSLSILPPDPPTWTELILNSVGTPPASYEDFAALDAETTGAGLAVGQSITLSVEVQYLGQGTPGPQPYDIWNPASFSQGPVETGTAGVASVPEPSTAGYMLLGILLAGTAWKARRSRRAVIARDTQLEASI